MVVVHSTSDIVASTAHATSDMAAKGVAAVRGAPAH
jgi:hypothetical protein